MARAAPHRHADADPAWRPGRLRHALHLPRAGLRPPGRRRAGGARPLPRPAPPGRAGRGPRRQAHPPPAVRPGRRQPAGRLHRHRHPAGRADRPHRGHHAGQASPPTRPARRGPAPSPPCSTAAAPRCPPRRWTRWSARCCNPARRAGPRPGACCARARHGCSTPGRPPPLPPRSAVLLGTGGNWYVDAATGAVGQARFRAAEATPPSPPKGRRRVPDPAPGAAEHPAGDRGAHRDPRAAPVQAPTAGRARRRDPARHADARLRLCRAGMAVRDVAEGDDGKQFVRVTGPARAGVRPAGPGGRSEGRGWCWPSSASCSCASPDGGTGSAKGRRVHLLRGPDAAEQWHRFLIDRVPAIAGGGLALRGGGRVRPARGQGRWAASTRG